MVLPSLSWILALKKYYIWNKKFLLTRNIKKKITPFTCAEKKKRRKIVLIISTLWYLPLLEILLRNPRLRTGSKALGLHERSWRAVIPSSSLSPTKYLNRSCVAISKANAALMPFCVWKPQPKTQSRSRQSKEKLCKYNKNGDIAS